MDFDAGRDPVSCPGVPPQRFILYRREDVNGMSGIGGVATGVVWPDGHAALRWKADDRDATSSTSVWSSLADLVRVHGHDGRSEIFYLDPVSDDADLQDREACCPRCHETFGIEVSRPRS